jgi:tetratricopeptide (TPR) repeat protein
MVPAPAELASAFRRGEFAGIAAVRPALGKLTRGDSARCAEWVALAHVRLGLLADALSLFDELIEVEPENASHCINLNSTLLAMGRVGEAWQHLRLGLLKWPESLPIRENYGLCCFALHRYEEAALVLNGTASGRGSSSDNARLYGVRALQEMGRFEEALLVSKDWSPDWRRFALAELYQYAKLLIVENRYDVAEPVLLSLCAQAPDETVAPLNLVAIYERSNRLDEAERLLDSLPQSAQTAPLYLLSRGKLHARRSRMTAALDWLDRCTALSPERLEDLEPERYFSEVEFERGRILDALGRFPDAFSAFASANALIRDLHRRYNPEAASAAGIGWLVDSPSMDELVRRTADTQPSTDSPIFIVGFPRSGTTLLDQILDAHPEFQVLGNGRRWRQL